MKDAGSSGAANVSIGCDTDDELLTDNDLFDKRKGLTDHFATAHVKTHKLCGGKVLYKEPIYPKHEPHVCILSDAPHINKHESGTSVTMRDAFILVSAHHVVVPIVHCNACKDNDLFDKRKSLTNHFAIAHVKTHKLCCEKMLYKELIYPKHEPHVCIPFGAPRINKHKSGCLHPHPLHPFEQGRAQR
ncbi:hypothetical protein GBA52_010855 [Prunus armeniaca]|nr:hypothetical protein GBA52_010855 [Prunus armeniaca]